MQVFEKQSRVSADLLAEEKKVSKQTRDALAVEKKMSKEVQDALLGEKKRRKEADNGLKGMDKKKGGRGGDCYVRHMYQQTSQLTTLHRVHFPAPPLLCGCSSKNLCAK